MFSITKLESRVRSVIRQHERAVINIPRIFGNMIRRCRPILNSGELEDNLAQATAQLASVHPAYERVAGRIAVGRMYKDTPGSFTECLAELTSGSKILNDTYVQSVMGILPSLEQTLVPARDFELPYYTVRAMEHYYLLRKNGLIVERPQYMFMRIAVSIHGQDLPSVILTYNLLSSMFYVHSSPAMANCGTVKGQLTFSFSMPFDYRNQDGVLRSLEEIGTLSDGGGAVGVSLSDTPGLGRDSTGNVHLGLEFYIKLIVSTLTTTEGSVKLPRGKATVFIEPWHPDIIRFIELQEEISLDTSRDRTVFFGLWVPDEFMKRVAAYQEWSLFDPVDVPELAKAHGENFAILYSVYERRGLAKKRIPARDIWKQILKAHVLTGGPYLLYKDHANRKSNQQHLGTATHSALCADVIQHCSLFETAVCNTASVVLPSFVTTACEVNYPLLHSVVKVIVRNLNRVGVVARYPSSTSAFAYSRHRSIGVGIQGLADTFAALRLPLDSQGAIQTGRMILETIYHAAMETSCEMVDEYGVYPTFIGSPLSHGLFQFDLWGESVSNIRYNWDELRLKIRNHGVANSQVIVLMATGDISQISGQSEGCEPLISNLIIRLLRNENYLALSSRLVEDLERAGLWTEEVRLQIIAASGSIQSIQGVPLWIKSVYRTAWEIPPHVLLEHAAARGPFVCQSQSTVLYMDNATTDDLDSVHFYSWRQGLKTGLYLLRSRSMLAFKHVAKSIYRMAIGDECDDIDDE